MPTIFFDEIRTNGKCTCINVLRLRTRSYWDRLFVVVLPDVITTTPIQTTVITTSAAGSAWRQCRSLTYSSRHLAGQAC